MMIILFLLLETKIYIFLLSTKDNKNLLKFLIKEFETSIYWNEYKTKSDNKNTTNKFRYFLESNFVRVKRLFVLIYSNEYDTSKRFKAKKYCLPKGIINNYNIIINGKNFYDQPIDSDINNNKKLEN